MSVIKILQDRSIKQPDKIAYKLLIDGEKEEVNLTYQQLEQQSRAISAYLQDLRATGERILLL